MTQETDPVKRAERAVEKVKRGRDELARECADLRKHTAIMKVRTGEILIRQEVVEAEDAAKKNGNGKAVVVNL